MTYNAYYLTDGHGIVSGPFSTVDLAVINKQKFGTYGTLLKIVKSTIEAEPV